MRKNKKYILGILVLAIIGIIFASGCVQEEKAEQEVGVHGDLKTVNGVRILKLNGTHYQMGYAHGFLLASDIINFINNIEVGLVVDSVNNYNSLIYFLPKAKFSQKYMDELNGMLDGMKASGQSLYIEKLGREVKIDDLKAINLMADTYEFFCSSFSAWGDFTKDGAPISGRNFDFPMPSTRTPVSKFWLLIAYEPESPNEKKWISVATPGMIGVLTGMSEDGIGIYDLSVHDVGTSPTDFYPMALVMRDAIDNAGGTDLVEDVYGTISDKTINRGYNYHITSPSNQVNVAGVIEGNYEGAELRYADYTYPDTPYEIVCTNYWVKRSSPFGPGSGVERYKWIENKASQFLNSGDQRIDSIEARKIMMVAATDTTQFILIFQSDSKEFDLAFIDKNYRFVHFKWSDFFD